MEAKKKEVYDKLRKSIDDAEARGDAMMGHLVFFSENEDGGMRRATQPVIIDSKGSGETVFNALVDCACLHGELGCMVSKTLGMNPAALALEVAIAVNKKAEMESMSEESDIFGKPPVGQA